MRRAALLGLLVCLLPASAFATDTRIQSMGGREKAWTVFDEINALYLPSTLLSFPNTIYADVGLSYEDAAGIDTPYDVGFGINLAFGKNTVVSLYGSTLSRQLSGNILDRAFGGEGSWEPGLARGDEDLDVINNADHKATLLFGQRLGDKFRLGVLLSIWADKYQVDAPEALYVKKGATWVEAGIGFGVDFSSKSNLDATFKMRFGSFDDQVYGSAQDPKVDRVNSDTHVGLDFLLRAVLDIGGEKLIPYANFMYLQGGAKYNREGEAFDEFYQLRLTAGVDLRIEPLENVSIYPGIGIIYYADELVEGRQGMGDSEVIGKHSVVTPFFGAGVDARISSWFALRLGLRELLAWTSEETGTQTTSESDAITDFTVGIGFFAKGFDIELMINPDLLLNGPYYVTGKGYDQFAFQGSLKYTW